MCRTEGREQLRLQAGTLRFDINSVADTLPKAAKKDVLAAKNEFFAVVSTSWGPLGRTAQVLAHGDLHLPALDRGPAMPQPVCFKASLCASIEAS